MNTDLVKIDPESLEVANLYLTFGNVKAVCESTSINPAVVNEILARPEVKRYIDSVYLDQGYRNRNTLGSLLDTIIKSKLEEAQETEMYTSKDLVDLITLAHKMRMDELKAAESASKVAIAKQNNIQINQGEQGGNIGKLVRDIMESES